VVVVSMTILVPGTRKSKRSVFDHDQEMHAEDVVHALPRVDSSDNLT
jgi:hypothetical protein